MRTRRVVSFLIAFVSLGSILIAGSAAFKPQPHYYSSAPPTGVTNLGSGTGCSCHGAGLTTSISGPGQLYPGEASTYTVSGTGGTNGTRFGMNVAATGGPLFVSSAALEVFGGEIRHRQSPATLTTVSGGAAFYSFTYMMAPSSTPGVTYTIAAAAAAGFGGAWAHAPNKSVAAIRPSNPSGLATGTVTSSSVSLTWLGSGPEYRVLYKTGTYPASATDGTIIDTSSTSTTASGLTASTTYYFAVYARATFSGTNTFSSSSSTAMATTSAALDPNPWVDAVNGNDTTNDGTSGAPFRTIKKALTAVGPGGTIRVRPGTYNATLGETFPITIPSGIKLRSTAGAATTIIDASGANPRTRVLYCTANNNSTLVEGFTITGGLLTALAPGNSNGGGILTENEDQTTISGCIITGNQARGYDGNASYPTGGYAYGGGLSITGRTKLVNNVISNNTARGGNGFGSGNGTDAHGGAISAYSITPGQPVIINNTINANPTIGGNAASGSTAAGGGALYVVDAQSASMINNIVSNNVVAYGMAGNGGPGPYQFGGVSANNATNNLYFNNPPGNGVTGTNAIIGADPQYVSAPADLHLRTSSPARLAGTSTGAPTVDLDNNPRTTPPTIGAYEIGLFLIATGGIGRITVTWTGVSGAASYNLYMSQTPGVTTSSTRVTGATSPYVIPALPNNTTYYFVMTAVENGVEGPISPEVSATTSNGTWVKAAVSGTGFTNLTLDLASGTTLYVTATDSAGVYKSTDSGDTWTALTGPVSNGTLRAVAANGSNVLVAGAGSIYRSINGGSSWTTSVTGAGIGEDFIASLAIDPLATNIVYAGDFHINGGSTATDLIAKSVDGGATFTNIIDPSSSDIRAYYLQIDPAISGTLYAAGSGTPNVAKSINNGSSWTSVSPVGGYPQSLALAPSSTLVLYLGMRDFSNSNSIGIYKSIDGGSNWTPMNTGLPGTLPDIRALLVDPVDVNRVHAGTAAGYYTSTNGASNWTLGPSGGAYPSASLQLGELAQTSTRRLVGISYDGTGIYLLPLNAAPSISNVSPLTGSSAGGDSVTVTGSGFTIASGLRVLFGGTDATVNLGASTSTSISVTTPAHAAGTVDVVVVNPDGQAAIRTSAFTYNVCTFQLSPASAGYSSSAATGSVTVTAPQGCSWTASAPGGSFVSITAGASGSGNGSVSYSVQQNSTGAFRSTTLTIAGQPFEITQSGSGTALFALTATASPTQVALSWASIGGGTSYQVWRSSGGGSFNLLTTTTALAYTDAAISAGTGYLYRIEAVGIGSSNVDLAVPFVYTDPTIAIGATPIKAAHFTELRQAANAARTAVGLAPMTFTGTIASGVVVQRLHLMELRSTVDGVRSAVGLAPVSYTDGVVTAGTTIIRRAHILDLRAGLQ